MTNTPGDCSNTLTGGIIYEPMDTSCVAASEIQATVPVFPDAEAGSCSTADLTISNTGAGELQVYQLNLTGRFYFDGGASSQVDPGFNVAPFSSMDVPIYFCPDVTPGQSSVRNGVAGRPSAL